MEPSLKGVILAGGTGSRLHPLTQITNKHLLPIYDRPMINYAIEALVKAGVTEMMLVTGGTHAGEFFRLLGNGHEHGVDRLFYAYQDRPGGIAEALGLAERFGRDGRIVVMLADNVVERSIAPAVENFAAQERGARILLARVEEPEHLRHLGVPELQNSRVTRIVEKPEQPPSEYAVTGIYFYDEQVWDVLPTLEPSGRGELEITDVNNWYVERASMEYDVLEGFWGDAGESIEAYYEVNDFVRANGANKDEAMEGARGGNQVSPARRSGRGGGGVVDGVEVIPLRRVEDERGWFFELRRESRLPKPTRQTNISFSRAGVIRGLHYHERGQDDLFACLQGTARVVVLDRESGETFTADIGDENPVAVYIPGRHAHGFEALTNLLFCYHVTEEYDPDDPDEQGVCWADPRVKHLWSTQSPVLSERDLAACS